MSRIAQLRRAAPERQAPHKLASKRWENKGARAGVARHEGFARADVGWCHEIRPCVDIGRQAARRNASAAARKTNPAIAALACVRVLFRQTGKCILRAMLAAGRRQHLAFGEHGSSPGAHLAAKPKRHNRRLVIPAAIPKSRPWKNMYWAALIARRAPACLRGPDWAASPQPAISRSCPPRARTTLDVATRYPRSTIVNASVGRIC